MAKSYRKGRLGEEIKKIIGDLLLKGIRDPRISERMVSVTDVDVSDDGSYATVYLSVLGASLDSETESEVKAEVLAGMKKAAGFFRKDISRKIKIRHVPELTFKIDESMEYGRHMSRILDSLDIQIDDEDEFFEEEVIEEIEEEDEVEESEESVSEEEYIDPYEGQNKVYELEEDERTDAMDAMAKVLMESNSMYIFPHMVADGDAVGSCAAMCAMMRKLGKEADILMEDEIPDNLMFLDRDFVKFVDDSHELPVRDLCLAMDCSNLDRFPKRMRLYQEAGRQRASIDHHGSNTAYAQTNLLDEFAASTTELTYELFLYMGLEDEIDKDIAEAIYTGISTDTGNFQYTNTTRKTHLIASDLYLYGIDTKTLNITLYQSERPQKLKLHSDIMSNMEVFHDGRASMAHVTLAMYEAADAKTSESDGINAAIRDLKGVEVAVFLREKIKDVEIKVGMRSKDYINVAAIGEKFDGGGHEHAAGCTLYTSMENAIEIMRKAVNEALEEYDLNNGLK